MQAYSVSLLWKEGIDVLYSCRDNEEHDRHSGIVEENYWHDTQKVQIDKG